MKLWRKYVDLFRQKDDAIIFIVWLVVVIGLTMIGVKLKCP